MKQSISLLMAIILFGHCTTNRVIYQYSEKQDVGNLFINEGDNIKITLITGREVIMRFSNYEDNFIVGYYKRQVQKAEIETKTKIDTNDIIKIEIIEYDEKKANKIAWGFVLTLVFGLLIAVVSQDCFPLC